ncbi:hypothetical protein D3C78_1248880 [compost metagenome]
MALTCSRFSASTLSVSSSSSSAGGRPLLRRVRSTIAARSAWRNCTADTLTATLSSGRPWACQAMTWWQASPSAHSPSGRISPLSSAMGMNLSGGTWPSTGLCQRISASQPLSRPLCRSYCGW